MQHTIEHVGGLGGLPLESAAEAVITSTDTKPLRNSNCM